MSAYSLEHLNNALENYNPEEFLKFVSAEAENNKLWSELRLDKANALVYKKLVSRCSLEIVDNLSRDIYLPYPVTRSIFNYLKIKVPNTLLQSFTPELALDAYFGAAYSPRRYQSTYEEGAKEILLNLVRKGYSWNRIALNLLDGDEDLTVHMSTASLEDFIEVWGTEVLGNWWKKTDYGEARLLCNNLGSMTGTEEEWFSAFSENFGPKRPNEVS